MRLLTAVLAFALIQALVISDDVLSSIKTNFFAKYEEQCLSYPYINEYLSLLHDEREEEASKALKYTIFVFQDHQHRAKIGGLGDRWAGLLTSFLWSMRSGRAFLVQDNTDLLFEYFAPISKPLYHLLKERRFKEVRRRTRSLYSEYEARISSTNDSHVLKWSNRNQWMPELDDKRMHGKYFFCVNPRSKAHFCACDTTAFAQDFTVARFRTNRAYLCRWVMHEQFPAHEELRKAFTAANHSMETVDWSHFSGCVLRSVLWPTHTLWQRLEEIYTAAQPMSMHQQQQQHPELNIIDALQQGGSGEMVQLGVHFRCGDRAFSESSSDTQTSTSGWDCVEKAGVQWKGTAPLEEHSSASPVDLAHCTASLLQNTSSTQSTSTVYTIYVTGDSAQSQTQIRTTVKQLLSSMHPKLPQHIYLLRDPFAQPNTQAQSQTQTQTKSQVEGDSEAQNLGHCHVAHDRAPHCLQQTLLSWTLLSLSDHLLLQAHNDPSQTPRPFLRPVSSFSRTAGWYALAPRTAHRAQPLAASWIYAEHPRQCWRSLEHHTHTQMTTQNPDIVQSSPGGPDQALRGLLPQGNWMCTAGDLY